MVRMSQKAIRIGFILGLVLLAVYSLALVYLEVTVSQEYVRRFVGDIEGPSRFYALNTTLCVFLEWGTALLFLVCATAVGPRPGWSREIPFYLSQAALFAYLGFDDRFRMHETIGVVLGINDAYVLLALGLIEAALLLFLGRIWERSRRLRGYFAAAGLCFAVTVAIDAFVPRELVPRLSLEKLTKTWGALFLFLFAWESLRTKIEALKESAREIGGGRV